MEPWIGSAIVTVVVAVIAGLATWITTLKKSALDQENAVETALHSQQLAYDSAVQELRLAYDHSLRDLRIPHYQRLYHASRCIPREWPEEPTWSRLQEFRQNFHEWYFGQDAGGLFLTARARDLYFRLQNELQLLAVQMRTGDRTLSPQESKDLRNLSSDLRHQLVQDLGTAEAPQFEWLRIGYTPAPPTG